MSVELFGADEMSNQLRFAQTLLPDMPESTRAPSQFFRKADSFADALGYLPEFLHWMVRPLEVIPASPCSGGRAPRELSSRDIFL